jgi:hypothetical protein
MRRSGVILGLAFLSLALIAVVAWQARLLRAQKATMTRVESPLSETAASFASSSSAPREEQSDPGTNRDGRTVAGATPANASPAQGAGSLSATNRPRFDWRQVESEDYRTYVKNLRHIGCPEQTVRDIVAADVLQAFAARRAEVMAESLRDFKYWKSDTEERATRERLESRRREADDAMGAALRELLGTDVLPPQSAAEWRQAALAQQLDFLPPTTREEAWGLLLQYGDVDAQIRELVVHQTPENPEERRRVIEAYEAKQVELRAVLTPEEFERVNMTVSWTGNNLRRAMTKFQPTEEEFRAIFGEWRAQDENLALAIAKGQPLPDKERVFAKIKELLPPERYEPYRTSWWK